MTWAVKNLLNVSGNGKDKYGDRIIEQLKSLGVSCDWERKRFTMDEGCSQAVREVFVLCTKKGLFIRAAVLLTGVLTAILL